MFFKLRELDKPIKHNYKTELADDVTKDEINYLKNVLCTTDRIFIKFSSDLSKLFSVLV